MCGANTYDIYKDMHFQYNELIMSSNCLKIIVYEGTLNR